MRTLIIPDIHNETPNADHWLRSQRYDRVVFLGDYFDNFGDSARGAARTARWLRDRMDSTPDIFLLGNHDAAYLFPYIPELECPGFTHSKLRAIRRVLQPNHWHRFQLAHFEQGWLLSHAGFHPSWLPEPSIGKILARGDLALQRARKLVFDPLLGAGFDRGGFQEFGGPLWMDFENLVPIPHIHQIVGHTPGMGVRETITRQSKNYCLDVRNASVSAILSAGKLRILTGQD